MHTTFLAGFAIRHDGFNTLAECQKVEFTITQGQECPQAGTIVPV